MAMPPSEKDHMLALRKQYQRKADAMERRTQEFVIKSRERIRWLKEQVRALDEMRRTHDLSIDQLLLGDTETDSEAPTSERSDIGGMIDRYLAERGEEDFTAPQV